MSDLELFDNFIAHGDFVDFICELVKYLPGSQTAQTSELIDRMEWLKNTSIEELIQEEDNTGQKTNVRQELIKSFQSKIANDLKFKAKFNLFLEELEIRELSKQQAELNTQSRILGELIEKKAKKRKQHSKV